MRDVPTDRMYVPSNAMGGTAKSSTFFPRTLHRNALVCIPTSQHCSQKRIKYGNYWTPLVVILNRIFSRHFLRHPSLNGPTPANSLIKVFRPFCHWLAVANQFIFPKEQVTEQSFYGHAKNVPATICSIKRKPVVTFRRMRNYL